MALNLSTTFFDLQNAYTYYAQIQEDTLQGSETEHETCQKGQGKTKDAIEWEITVFEEMEKSTIEPQLRHQYHEAARRRKMKVEIDSENSELLQLRTENSMLKKALQEIGVCIQEHIPGKSEGLAATVEKTHTKKSPKSLTCKSTEEIESEIINFEKLKKHAKTKKLQHTYSEAIRRRKEALKIQNIRIERNELRAENTLLLALKCSH